MSSAVIIAGVVRRRYCSTAKSSSTSSSSKVPVWLSSTRRTSHNIAAQTDVSAVFRSKNNHTNWTAISVATAAASCLPLIIWARDSLFGFVRVEGNSMEPTLRHGDVLLVRKADPGFLPHILVNAIFGQSDVNDDAPSSSLAREQRRVRQHDMQAQLGGGIVLGGGGGNGIAAQHHHPNANLYDTPPLVVSGQVAVLLSPDTAFPSEWIVKRVIGVGGQWLLPPPQEQQQQQALSYRDEMMSSSKSRKNHHPHDPRRQRRHHPASSMMYQRTKLLPPYTLYVQGDHPDDDSRDSRQYGPVSKNLLVGVAEFVVWPPTRWQRIRRRNLTLDDDDDDDDDDDKNDDFSHMQRAYWL